MASFIVINHHNRSRNKALHDSIAKNLYAILRKFVVISVSYRLIFCTNANDRNESSVLWRKCGSSHHDLQQKESYGMCKTYRSFGAADGSRTHLRSLGSFYSTDELQPHIL